MAVNGISFNLDKGKILGIVGESGSGKSVTAYSIMRILESNGSIKGGQVLYKGEDVTKFSEKKMREFRGKCCSIIFQDPMTSLNPVFTVGNQLREMCIRDRCMSICSVSCWTGCVPLFSEPTVPLRMLWISHGHRRY